MSFWMNWELGSLLALDNCYKKALFVRKALRNMGSWDRRVNSVEFTIFLESSINI